VQSDNCPKECSLQNVTHLKCEYFVIVELPNLFFIGLALLEINELQDGLFGLAAVGCVELPNAAFIEIGAPRIHKNYICIYIGTHKSL